MWLILEILNFLVRIEIIFLSLLCPFEALSQIVINGFASWQDLAKQMNYHNLILIY